MPKSSFHAAFFAGNRKKLRTLLPHDYPIVLFGHGSLQRTADTTYPFQQDSNFWYLTGIDEPDMCLVITAKSEFLITPTNSSVKTVFDGAPDVGALKARSGIHTVHDEKTGWKLLTELAQRHTAIYTPKADVAFDAAARIYANPAARHNLQKLQRKAGKFMVHDLQATLAGLRMKKQAPEIAAIERAIDITVQTLADVRDNKTLAKLGTEYALEAAITNGFRSRGADGHAYAPIVASGAHGTTLHYVANSGTLPSGELIVADVGAEYEHYAADITRTISVSKPTVRQQSVLDAVLDIQQHALELLKPGTSLRQYEYAVAVRVGQALRKLKLIETETNFEAIRKYFPHASSHFLGLDVHDTGDYNAPLEPGMVLTCEPGIYIPEEGIGVRIEDDVLITETGNRNLSAHCSYDAYVLH